MNLISLDSNFNFRDPQFFKRHSYKNGSMRNCNIVAPLMASGLTCGSGDSEFRPHEKFLNFQHFDFFSWMHVISNFLQDGFT